MNAKKTLKKLRGESDRASHSIYISKTILEEFKDACGEITHSRVIEQLLRDFLDDYSKKEKSSILKKVAVKKS